jgi:undecaprenyl pyrophosphate phosphatase UppP
MDLYLLVVTIVLGTWREDPGSRRFLLNGVIATVPAVAVGFLAHDWIVTYLFGAVTVAGALMVGGGSFLVCPAPGLPS